MSSTSPQKWMTAASGKRSWVSGETKRIALVCFQDKEGKQTPKFVQQKEFSKFGAVLVIWFEALHSITPISCRCTFLFNEAKPRIGTIVLEYETDTNGLMLQGGGYKLKAFVFSPDKLILLQALTKGGWDSSEYDIMATCARATMRRNGSGSRSRRRRKACCGRRARNFRHKSWPKPRLFSTVP